MILKYCENITNLIKLHGSEETDFSDNISLQYGCAFALMQIGEHVKRLSPELTEKHPEIEWKGSAKIRDFIAHNYMEVDIERVRYTVLEKIPLIESECRAILSEF